MKRFNIEVAKAESRTPLFYYPYHVVLKSDLAKFTVAKHFFSQTTSYILSMRKKDLALLTEENMKKLSGRYDFHYDDPQETEGQQIGIVRHVVPAALGRKGISGFKDYIPGLTTSVAHLVEGKDFEIVIGERVDIEQPVKLTFDDIPDLMGVESE